MADALPLEDLQLPHLETFAKAAELSSFTAAAKALRLTQSAVSQRVQTLEAALGKSLFQRRGGRVLVTGAGQKLYDYSQRILDLHRQARREVTGQTTPLAAELLIAASSIPGEHLLPALLSVFHEMEPHIRVRAAVGDSMAVIAQVERGDVSLGLVGRKTDHPHLVFRHLTRDKLVLVVPRTHALCRRKTVTLEQLLAYPMVMREKGSGSRHGFEQALERAGRAVADLKISLELGSNEAIKEAVRRGAGAAVLSIYAVQEELKAKRLRAVEISDLPYERDLFIVHDQRRVMPLPARLFLDFLANHPVAQITS